MRCRHLPQAEIECSEAKANGSLSQAAIRDAVQHKLEDSAAAPATRRRQSKRSMQAGESPGQQAGTLQRKSQPAAAGQAALGDEDSSGRASPSGPVTPEYQHRTRQGRTRQKAFANN